MHQLKKFLKSILIPLFGTQRLRFFKGFMGHCLYRLKSLTQKDFGQEIVSDEIKLKGVIEAEGFHVYRGYYDIDYVDAAKNRFLCNRLPLQAGTNRDNTLQVGYYDLGSMEFHKIGETNAWCWQQGCRLRWHPQLKDRAMYNDATNKGYCCRVVNVETDECEQVISKALYDITSDAKLGISVNYSRLQRLRPGYGYNYLDDETAGVNAPADDGIFLVDMEKDESRLLYSLKDLAKAVDPQEACEHYINHVCIAPDGKHFMFFHIYVAPQSTYWRTVLYVSDIEGKNLKMLEKEDNVSHYCWLDNRTLLETDVHMVPGGASCYYCTYDITTGKKTILPHKALNTDGHPTRFPGSDLCVTDTYPQMKNHNRQRVMIFNLKGSEAHTIANLYHDYRMYEERRCDLHPSLGDKGRIISVDTTCRKGKRSIILFEVVK